MQGSAFEPYVVGRDEIEINDGGEAESEIGAGNLCTISSPEFRMGIDGIIIERRRVPHVHVRINESGNEIASGPVDPTGMWAGNQILADISDQAVTEHDISVEEWGGAFRRNECDILDHRALIDRPLGACRGRNMQKGRPKKRGY